jgi:threonine aldolase
MMEAMMSAPVGDDVFGEDPTVNALEEKVAKMFSMEAGIYCPSGTMTNQIAIKILTQPGDEVICHRLSHVYNYEGGGIAFNAGASVRLIEGNRGFINVGDILTNINSRDDVHKPLTTLVCLENTGNRAGGSVFTLKEIENVSRICNDNGLCLHMDGARLFNALIATGDKAADYGKYFDTISLCISKGLGAPVGSVLVGSKEYIRKARRVRKVFGGGMRQAGTIAAACIYALDNHVERLADDHRRATALNDALQRLPWVKEVLPVESNIVIFHFDNSKFTDKAFIQKLRENNILAISLAPGQVRFVTHLDFTDNMLDDVVRVLRNL